MANVAGALKQDFASIKKKKGLALKKSREVLSVKNVCPSLVSYYEGMTRLGYSSSDALRTILKKGDLKCQYKRK